MAFDTCSPDIVKYWRKQRVPAKLIAKVDGVSYVHIEIPDNDPRLKDPAFFKLAVKSKRYENDAVVRHMCIPIYTIMKEGKFSDTLDKEGNRAVPLTRQVGLLSHFFTDPERKEDEPEFVVALLARKEALFSLFAQALDEGVQKILYLATPLYTLDFSVSDTYQLLKYRK